MSKIKTSNGYKNIDEVYSGETYITEIYDKNGIVLYTADRKIQNSPPMTFKSRGKNLKNYRIYGNTVNGESVGDRTGNLFDESKITENKYVYNSSFNNSTASNISEYISISNGLTYTLSWNVSTLLSSNPRQIGIYDNQKNYLGNIQYEVSGRFSTSFTVNIANAAYIVITIDKDFQNTMLNSGSTALPYEPYGYRVPVTVTNGTDTETTNIYLPEQIKMVGDEAEYIDFGEQKQYFANGTSVDITLPALPTLSGTNTLSVGTEVQPSEVYVKGTIRSTT